MCTFETTPRYTSGLIRSLRTTARVSRAFFFCLPLLWLSAQRFNQRNARRKLFNTKTKFGSSSAVFRSLRGRQVQETHSACFVLIQRDRQRFLRGVHRLSAPVLAAAARVIDFVSLVLLGAAGAALGAFAGAATGAAAGAASVTAGVAPITAGALPSLAAAPSFFAGSPRGPRCAAAGTACTVVTGAPYCPHQPDATPCGP